MVLNVALTAPNQINAAETVGVIGATESPRRRHEALARSPFQQNHKQEQRADSERPFGRAMQETDRDGQGIVFEEHFRPPWFEEVSHWSHAKIGSNAPGPGE